LARAGDRDRENLSLILNQPRQNESGELAAAVGAVRDDMAVAQQAFNFLLAPAAAERVAMQHGDRGRVARTGVRQDRLAAREQV